MLSRAMNQKYIPEISQLHNTQHAVISLMLLRWNGRRCYQMYGRTWYEIIIVAPRVFFKRRMLDAEVRKYFFRVEQCFATVEENIGGKNNATLSGINLSTWQNSDSEVSIRGN